MPFNLDQLTEFNPALIYLFQPEGHPLHMEALKRGMRGSSKIAHYPMMAQYFDMLKAYLYAEVELLPIFKRDAELLLTPEALLLHLNAIHKRIAHTIGTFEPKNLRVGETSLAGRYSDTQIIHWHYEDLQNIIALYFLGILPDCLTVADLVERFCPEEMPKEAFSDFILLLERYMNDDSMHFERDNSVPPGICDAEMKRISVLQKAIYGYQNNQISDHDRIILEKVMRIPPRPSQYNTKMREFAESTIKNFYTVDTANIESVSQFLTDVIVSLIEIHPYANGNKRTANCITNLFARALGYKSFLIRVPEDNNDPQSSYKQAFEGIYLERGKIARHIQLCLERAEHSPFSCSKKRALTEARIRNYELSLTIMSRHPQFDLDAFEVACEENLSQQPRWQSIDLNDDESLRAIALAMSEMYQEKLDALDKAQAARSVARSGPGFFDTKTTQDVNTIKAHLMKVISEKAVTRVMQAPNGLIYLYQFEDKMERDAFVEKYQAYEAFVVTRRAKGDKHFASIERVDKQKLLMLAESARVAAPNI